MIDLVFMMHQRLCQGCGLPLDENVNSEKYYKCEVCGTIDEARKKIYNNNNQKSKKASDNKSNYSEKPNDIIADYRSFRLNSNHSFNTQGFKDIMSSKINDQPENDLTEKPKNTQINSNENLTAATDNLQNTNTAPKIKNSNDSLFLKMINGIDVLNKITL